MKLKQLIKITALLAALILPLASLAQEQEKPLKKVLIIGDSMTGWMSERWEAYGQENGFTTSTIVWDGSTISKWANSPKLKSIIDKANPDLVVISLGMNELFETAPKKLDPSMKKILEALGQRDFVWVGPPSWPGHNKGKILDAYLEEKVGKDHYYSSLGLEIPRQTKTNPHPTKDGMRAWTDFVVEWINAKPEFNYKRLNAPKGTSMVRGRDFVYKKLKENL